MSSSNTTPLDFSNQEFATNYYYGVILEADVEGLIDPVKLYGIAEQTALESVKSMSEADALELLVANTRIHTKSDPYYAKMAAQVLYKKISIAAFEAVGGDIKTETEATTFIKYIDKAIQANGITPEVREKFDLERLASVIDIRNNYLFDYLGLQTLYDRYFLHDNEVRYELPQQFLMRVAMGLCLNEDNPTERAIVAYVDAYSSFNYMSSTPTLFNSATLHPQMSSCYLTTIEDDLFEIYGAFRDNAMLSKWAGGIGNDWTPVRALNAHIKGTNGKSQGIVPFLKVNNDTAVAVNQCFDLSTPIYIHTGVAPIGDVKVGDLVLGKSGAYREVLEVKDYDQPETDPMVLVDIKHGEEPLKVTAGHPFLTLRGYSKGGRTPDLNNPTKTSIEWVEAKDLTSDDLVAQVIPQEIVIASGFHNDEALLLGILLGDGHCTQTTNEWGVSGAHLEEEHIAFTINYLRDRGIHYWVNGDESHVQVKWSRNVEKFYFTRDDIYTADNQKYVNSKFINTNNVLTTLIIKGLLITDGNVSRGKELTFSTGSVHLLRGLRYLLLRNAIPTSVYKREREYNHMGTRATGEQVKFEGDGIEYVLRIPATGLITSFVDVKPLTKFNWVQYEHFLFSRVKSVTETESSTVVRDLIIEGDESYMLTSGLAHNGGKRKGAIAAYLETFHLDVEEFLELRKNTGDDRRRTHDMNTANWIPDLFMKRVFQNGSWTLFTPNEVPDLHELAGREFEERYEHYEANAKKLGLMHKTIRAKDLWQKMLSMLFETGHPWLTFKDACNIRSPQRHVGVVHSSNLCTEITLNTNKDEVAVCNLGSINVPAHINKDGSINVEKLRKTIRIAVRLLDNVIDINYYPIPQAANSNLKHRPIGLGIMGFQDALYIKKIPYSSDAAVEFADEFQELVSYFAIEASADLAQERGAYETFEGSDWHNGILPIDTLKRLEEERGADFCDFDYTTRLDWDTLRAKVKLGMRNSNVMAIAPTATIANITGVSQSIEPTFQNLYVKSNLSGEFTIINKYLVNDLKERGLWSEELSDMLKTLEGDISKIEGMPEDLVKLYATAFQNDPRYLVKAAARRQKWIDQAQSFNMYIDKPNGKKLDAVYKMTWVCGCKTNYYLRAMGATTAEKSTTGTTGQTFVLPSTLVDGKKACSILDPDCDACQ